MHVVAGSRIVSIGLAALWLLTTPLHAQTPKDDAKKPVVHLPVGTLDTKAWLKSSTKPLEAGEIDRLVNAELSRLGVKPAVKTTDEQFIRRVSLDLTGKMPAPKDITDFVADKAADKRATLIDQHL